MGTIQSHRDLEAWSVSMDLATEVYKVSEGLPAKETYGLQAQMRRAAVSVPSNVAEGHPRPIRAALNYLSIALGSLGELDTQLEIAVRLKYLDAAAIREVRKLMESSRKLIWGLHRAKRARLAAGTTAVVGLLLLLFVG